MTLTDFLLARIAEDEARWASAEPPFSSPHDPECDYPGDMPGICDCNLLTRLACECEAKRRIVDEAMYWERIHGQAMTYMQADDLNLLIYKAKRSVTGDMLRFLALPYADHPEYRAEWRL